MSALDPSLPVDQFAPLAAVPGGVHGFVTRVSGIDVRHDKAEALRRLDAFHHEVRAKYGASGMPFITAEQVHGNEVQVIDRKPTGNRCFEGCDGLITNQPGTCLGIYVADCCAVYLVDPTRRCLGLVHSGRRGTELNITGRAIDLMTQRFYSKPEDLIVQLSPCIRPPNYEVDFAAEIVRVCRERGLKEVHDVGMDTASDLERYYSYRVEKGKTGRMLAFLALTTGSNRI